MNPLLLIPVISVVTTTYIIGLFYKTDTNAETN